MIRIEIGKTINPLCFKTMLHQGFIKKIVPELLNIGFKITCHAKSTRYYWIDYYTDIFLTSCPSIIQESEPENKLYTIHHNIYEKLISRKFYQYQYKNQKYFQKKGLILPLDFKICLIEQIKKEYKKDFDTQNNNELEIIGTLKPECIQFEEVLILKYQNINIYIREIIHKTMEENNTLSIEVPYQYDNLHNFESIPEINILLKIFTKLIYSHNEFISRKNQVAYDLDWLNTLNTNTFSQKYLFKSITIPTSFFYLMDNTPIGYRLKQDSNQISVKISKYTEGQRRLNEDEIGKEANLDELTNQLSLKSW